MKIRYALALAALVLPQISTSSDAHAESIKIAAVDWCPQMCPDDENSGYILEVVEEVFKGSEYSLEVDYYPWTRAVAMVESGRAHALLSPTKNETPGLVFPNNEVGVQRVCFFTQADSGWNYTGTDSLNGLTIGAFKGGDYGEIMDYMSQNTRQFQLLQGDGDFVEKSIKKLNAGRLDAFLYTHNAMIHEIQGMGIADKYRSAGCVVTDKLFVAFTSSQRYKNTVDSLVDYWDARMIELKKTDKIGQIMTKYGLEDWSKPTL